MQQKSIVHLSLFVFLFQNLQQQQKIWKQITPSSLNQHAFY